MVMDNNDSGVAEAVIRRPWLLGLCCGLSLFAFAITGVLLLHKAADTALESSMRESLRGITLATANTIDVAIHSQIHDSPDKASPAFQQTVEPLEGLVRSIPHVRSIYTLRSKNDGTIAIVVKATAESLPVLARDIATTAAYRTLNPCTDTALLQSIRGGVTTASSEIHTDEYGSFLSAYSPVRDSYDKIECFVGVDMDVEALLAEEAEIHLVVGICIAFAFVGSTGLGIAVRHWQGRKVHSAMMDRMERIQLLRAESAAIAANQGKDDFIANVSHEIRTPLAAIIGYAELLREQRLATGNALADSAPDAIVRNSAHLMGVVNDILDVSQVEAGALALHTKRMDLGTIAREAAELLAVRATAKGITLTVDCPHDIAVEVDADALRVRQILLNLIGNAIKFTEHGGVRVVISQTGPWAVAEVHDSGPGMTAEQLDRLFKRFSRVDQDSTSLGTGIGLELSQRLARLMQGGIAVESTPGVGATFRLSLMRAHAVSESAQALDLPTADSAHEANELGPLPLAGIDVLMAEDSIDNARLWRHHLEQAGAEVRHATNGREAIGLVRAAALGVLERPFDIVLMDMEMPIMGGVEATMQLRAEGFRLPIVGLTAHSDGTSRSKLLAAGCDDCATKPITRADLARLILAHVGTVHGKQNARGRCPVPNDSDLFSGLRATQS